MISNNLRRLTAGAMASLILPFHVPSGATVLSHHRMRRAKRRKSGATMPKRGENGGDWLSVGQHKIGRGGDVVDRRMRKSAGRLGGVDDQRDDVPIVGIKRRLAVGGAKHFNLWQEVAL